MATSPYDGTDSSGDNLDSADELDDYGGGYGVKHHGIYPVYIILPLKYI